MLDITDVDEPGKLWNFVQEYANDDDLITEIARVLFDIGTNVRNYYLSNGLEYDYVLERRPAKLMDGLKECEGFSFVFVYGPDGNTREGIFLEEADDAIVNWSYIGADTQEEVEQLH